MAYTQIVSATTINAETEIVLAPRTPTNRLLKILVSFDAAAHDAASLQIGSDAFEFNGGVPLLLGYVHGGVMPYEFDFAEGLGVPGTATVTLGSGGVTVNNALVVQYK